MKWFSSPYCLPSVNINNISTHPRPLFCSSQVAAQANNEEDCLTQPQQVALFICLSDNRWGYSLVILFLVFAHGCYREYLLECLHHILLLKMLKQVVLGDGFCSVFCFPGCMCWTTFQPNKKRRCYCTSGFILPDVAFLMLPHLLNFWGQVSCWDPLFLQSVIDHSLTCKVLMKCNDFRYLMVFVLVATVHYQPLPFFPFP